MARANCKGCGVLCCTCSGCNPAVEFKDGLCKTCYQKKLEKENAASKTN
jgi:hypothetical protein